MAGTRPSAVDRSESPHSDPWWEAEEFASIEKSAPALRAASDWPGLEELYGQGYELARRRDIVGAQIAYLTALGNTRILRARYPEALQAYFEGKRLAESSGDWRQVGLIALNLVGVYELVWDYDSALSAAEEGILALRRHPRAINEFRAQQLLQLGRLYSVRRDSRAEALLKKGIEAARAQGDAALEARGGDLLGEWLQAQGRLEEADGALTEAYRLRVLHFPAELRLSYGRLGSLKLAQFQGRGRRGADLEQASRLTRKALDLNGSAPGRSGYLLHQQLGEVLREQGKVAEALAEFRASVVEAAHWRGTLPAATSALTGSNAALDRSIFDSFVETAVDRASATGEPRWAEEAFLATEANRAASLRETRALAGVWRRKLPPSYWEILSELRNEEGRLMRRGQTASPGSDRLRLKLTEMESSAGLGFFSSIPESFLNRSSLVQIQHGLRDSEILLSFRLGEAESLLWTVTNTGIRLYRLDAESVLRAEIERFRTAVIEERAEAVDLGQELYLQLFGRLGPEEIRRPHWLLSVEGGLFRLPFAALVVEKTQSKVSYLVEKHSVQVVPGAFFLSPEAPRVPGGHRVLVADPVYNTADPRIARSWIRQTLLAWTGGESPSLRLNRLPASRAEVDASIRSSGSAARFTVLDGTGATVPRFLDAVANAPEAIHLATHVLNSGNGRGQAFIAFSLGRDGQPEMLATSDVAMMNVAGSLVVMTGCATGAGDVVEGTGLLGLTRGWLVAGASNVIATGWEVEDRAEGVIPAFYRHWQSLDTAEALRRSQVEAIAAGGPGAAPGRWAAYQLSGGNR